MSFSASYSERCFSFMIRLDQVFTLSAGQIAGCDGLKPPSIPHHRFLAAHQMQVDDLVCLRESPRVRWSNGSRSVRFRLAEWPGAGRVC